MKRWLGFIFSALVCFSLAACSQTLTLELPFQASDIAFVEIFHFIDPADAEKKVITQQDDIQGIYSLFQGLALKEQSAKPSPDSACTGVRFSLSDGTCYEIAYWSVAVKSGKILTTELQSDYTSSADIGASWNHYDYEAVSAAEAELPLLR